MSRRHEPLPDELPNQQLELVDPARGPRVVRLTVSGDEVVRTYGLVASAWQTKRERFPEPRKAFRAASAQLSRLLARGYEIGGRNLELEAMIAAAPDDPASYLVYADWLSAQGNPIGEYISVAVAVDERPDDAELVARERRLLCAHALLLTRPHWDRVCWRFGFVEGIETNQPVLNGSIDVNGSWLRLPLEIEYRSTSGYSSVYHMGYGIIAELNSVARLPMGGFVRRVYNGERVFGVRWVAGGGDDRGAWELIRLT